MRSVLFPLAVCIALTACAPENRYVETRFEPMDPNYKVMDKDAVKNLSFVQIYKEAPDEPYRMIGEIEARGRMARSSLEFINHLKLEAAKRGANGIILYDEPHTEWLSFLTLMPHRKARAYAIKLLNVEEPAAESDDGGGH